MSLQFKHDLIFLDCEMTGPDPDKHQIYEICAIRVNKQTLMPTSEYHSFCGPSEGQSFESLLDSSSNFCLSNNSFAKNLEKIKLSPNPNSVITNLIKWLPERYFFAGFNLYLDLEFMNKVIRDLRLKHQMWYQYIDLNTVMELYLAKNNFTDIASQYAFAQLLGVDANPAKLHDAKADCQLSISIFRKCLSKDII